MSFTRGGKVRLAGLVMVAIVTSCFPTLGLSETGTPLGKLHVPAEAMDGRCITRITPHYPQNAEEPRKAARVIVRVVIWKSGNVSPVQVVSGPPAFQTEAMDAVRLWRYRPYTRDGEPLDVATDIRVDFDPSKPGGDVVHPAH